MVLNLYIVCHVFVMTGPEYYKAAYLVLGLDFYALLLSIDISCTPVLGFDFDSISLILRGARATLT